MTDIVEIEIKIKAIIIESLNLEDMDIGDISATAPLFSEDGVGLDSIDALELGIQIGKIFGVKLSANASENRAHFYSVNTLATYVQSTLQGIK